ncbi:MAG: glycosyltransferase, partial [Bacteroidota bacterium]
MISVLIPVYNYDIISLVGELHRQLIELKIEFEIICWDDASKNIFQKSNQKIEIREKVTYRSSKKNLGRNSTRQLLAETAKFDWLLFLDADVLPKSNLFIKTYLKFVEPDYSAVYGGICYDKQNPSSEFALRWTYGSMKEVVKAKTRNKKPYKHTVSANFLIYKPIFLKLNSKIEQS